MRVLRTAAAMAICLWLVLPGTQTFAVCINHHGGVALELADDGAHSCSEQDGRGRLTERTAAITASHVHCCGDCTDVVLRGAGDAVPSGEHPTKRTRARATDEVDQAASLNTSAHLRAEASGRPHPRARTFDLHSTTGLTVLRL